MFQEKFERFFLNGAFRLHAVHVRCRFARQYFICGFWEREWKVAEIVQKDKSIVWTLSANGISKHWQRAWECWF